MSKPKISVLTWCYSRQSCLDRTLPYWLAQDYPNFEIVVGCGPNIALPDHPNVIRVDTPTLGMGRAYNAILARSTGSILMLTQSDMEAPDRHQLSKMYEKWHEKTMVTEKFIKDGRRDCGMFLQAMMVSKKAILEAGGWDEDFDDPGTAAFEDSHICAKLLENGYFYTHIESPEDTTMYHIDHPKPDYAGDPAMLARVNKGRELYLSKHKYHLTVLYFQSLKNKRLYGTPA